MAEHELRIKATLDTQSVQRELDQINKSIMVQNGATGQIQGGSKSGAAQNLTLPIRNLQKSIESLNRQLAKLGLQAHDRAREVVSRISGGSVIDTIDPLPIGKATGPKTAFGRWVKANRFSRADAMPLFMMSSWGSRLGEAFTDAGHEDIGGAIDLLGDIAGGAAAGSIRGGPRGAVVGALVAAFASVTKSVAKFNNELEKSIKLLGDNIEDARQTREVWRKTRIMSSVQDYVREIMTSEDGNFTKIYKLQSQKHSPLEMAKTSEISAYQEQKETLSAIEAAEKALSMLQEELKGVQDEGYYQKIKRVLPFLSSSNASLNDLNAQVFGRKIRQDLLGPTGRSKGEINKDIEEVTKNLKTNKELLKQQQSEEAGWKSLRHTIEDAIRSYKKADEKWMKDYEKQQKESAEQTKKLNDERENIIRQIQADYTQQGVDILSSMGKTGKYMSTMEQASLSQERFSPITKRMDNMQKSLDHLAKIDREISKLDTGLKP